MTSRKPQPATAPRMEPGLLELWRLSDGGTEANAWLRIRRSLSKSKEVACMRFRTLMHCAFVCQAVTGGGRCGGGRLVQSPSFPVSGPTHSRPVYCVLLRRLSTEQSCRRLSACDAAIDLPTAATGEIKCGWMRPLICPRPVDPRYGGLHTKRCRIKAACRETG